MKLVIGDKNYSSWSMRPWLVLKHFGIECEEVMVWLNEADTKAQILAHSPSGKVPCLIADDGVIVWDSLAICETLAELFPDRCLWPSESLARMTARAVSAEMHSGFGELRKAMPMNIRSLHPDKGRTPGALKDIERIAALWEACRNRFGGGGDLLFGAFSCADAMFAPVVMRFETYRVSLPPVAQRYADAVRNLPSVQEWCAGALAETEFVPADEPYATRV